MHTLYYLSCALRNNDALEQLDIVHRLTCNFIAVCYNVNMRNNSEGLGRIIDAFARRTEVTLRNRVTGEGLVVGDSDVWSNGVVCGHRIRGGGFVVCNPDDYEIE